jgi:ATP-dependent DNA helicase RecG
MGASFRRIAREARAWLDAPSADGLARLEAAAREASPLVPSDRREDWDKLLSGFASADAPRNRPRVQGLVRACSLFEREARARARRATPLGWEDPVERVDGVGPTSREKLAAHGVTLVSDLAWTLPVAWDDLRAPVGVDEAIDRARACEAALESPPRVCVRARVKGASFVPMRGRRAVRVVVTDEGGKATLDAWWFYAAHGILGIARPGSSCLLVGRVRSRDGKRPSMAHPDVLRDDASTPAVRARYPSLGIAPGILRRAVADAVERTSPLPDPVPAKIVAREGMPPAEPLLRSIHGTGPDARPETARPAAAERLAWVEAFTRVWQRLLAEAQWGGGGAPVLARDPAMNARLAGALGFTLTGAQERAIESIARDLASTFPMRRLLLGDVGTGKTAVALAAAGQCVAAGFQCALLLPTGVLAEQYVDAAEPLVRAAGVRLARVASGMRAAERREVLARIQSGEAQLVLGTHALLQEDIRFARLGLVIVDEQQRLGVAQRLTLVRKGREGRQGGEGDGTRPHLLSLSATPIPRSLALALRGELATSVLDERPRGRVPVTTELRARSGVDDVLGPTRSAFDCGERVFVVCPTIDDDPEEEGLGVTARADRLASDLGAARVVAVHGAMPAADRALAMRRFRTGEAQVLVGTTVIEVGIDVPEATLMVIDGAERFGLAQLHQLRGRVGRGERPGRCLLLYDEPLTDLGRRRLETLAGTTDGAEIARADLALRGSGDLGGTRQSGVAEEFVWLDPADPPAWLERIEADARALLAEDERLAAPEHRALALAVRRFAVQIAVREEAG